MPESFGGFFTGTPRRIGQAQDELDLSKDAFSDQFVGDTSRDNLGDVGTFGVNNDLNRLEVIASNEGPALNRRLKDQLDQLGRTADRVGEGRAVGEASGRARRNSDNDKAQFERASRGFDLSARQKKSAGRRLGLSRSLNRASAAGNTRRDFADRSRQATSTGGSFSDAIFSQRVQGETAIASAFTQQENSENQERADKASGKNSALGGVVGGILSIFSSKDYKHDLGTEENLLNKLKKVRVNRWQYKGDNKTHVGAFAEEFNKEFGMDTDRPDMINVIDALGVTMGAVKELDRKLTHART